MYGKAYLVAALSLVAISALANAEPVDPAQAIAQKFFEASEPKAERPTIEYEMEMLNRARAEKIERRSGPADVHPVVNTSPSQDPSLSPLPATGASQPDTFSLLPKVSAKLAESQPAAAAAPVKTTPVTVLLALDTDDTSVEKAHSPDPIICIDQNCYLSSGFETPAREMPRVDALALRGTSAAKAETCRGKFGCVYRSIAIPENAEIRVVDFGAATRPTDTGYTISPDATCKKANNELECDNALVTHDFRVWIVPEATAKKAGIQLLEDAVAEGLQVQNISRSNDK